MDLEYVTSYSDKVLARVQVRNADTASGKPERPLIFLPGLLNSRLVRESKGKTKVLWKPALSSLLFANITGCSEIAKNASGNDIIEGIFADRISTGYDRLIRYFHQKGYGNGFTDSSKPPLIVVPYDWRNSVSMSASRELGTIMSKISQQGYEQVDILAHSLGGLVARYYCKFVESTRINRMIMLGVPHFGAPRMYSLLKVGLLKPIFSDISHGTWIRGERLRNLASHFPSMYELLPDRGYLENFQYITQVAKIDGQENVSTDPQSLYSTNEVTALKGDDTRQLLLRALKLKDDLGWDAPNSIPTINVYSDSSATIGGLRFGTKKVLWVGVEGDGEVPWSSEKLLKNSLAYETLANHGDMARRSGSLDVVNTLLRNDLSGLIG
jgi:pimeloyl-ACP methyl ester carboxylesterase